jgi:hypothetical protein
MKEREMKMKPTTSKVLNYIFIIAICLLLTMPPAFAGNKKIMTTRAAKIIAERAIVESVYGLKLRATEKVEDMIAASFVGTTESKTSAKIKGIKIEDVVYDSEKDIAKATASIQLDYITNIDGKTINLNNKIFRRVGFATSTPSQSGPLKALRAAEMDAYNQIIKRIVGFTLESQSTVKNYMLTSDIVKTKVMATTYLAEVVDYGWDESGDAFVKMQLNTKEVAAMMGEEIIGEDEIIEVEGAGAQEDDYKTAQKK